jgi:adenylate kinase family enzyme
MKLKHLLKQGRLTADKIIVIGKPGSGKTYLTEVLKDYFDGIVVHIDNILWENPKVPLNNEELNNKLEIILHKDNWLIDGTYLKTLSNRIEKASLIFYLDISEEVCIQSVIKRKKDEKIIHGCEDYEGFIEYIKKYDIANKPIIENLLLQHSNKSIIRFTDRKQVDEFIAVLKSNK